MNKQGKLNVTLVHLVIGLSGLVFLLPIGYLNESIVTVLLQAIGTALIAAAITAYLTRRFLAPAQLKPIQLAAANRMILENTYIKNKMSASKIDISAVALSGCLKELATDSQHRVLNRVVQGGAKIRLLFLNPHAPYVQQRALEDGVPKEELVRILTQSLIYCLEIHQQLTRIYNNAKRARTIQRKRTGSLEIRMTDMCPRLENWGRTSLSVLWVVICSKCHAIVGS